MVDIVLALEDGIAIPLNSSQRLARNKYKSPSVLKLLLVEALHHSNTSLVYLFWYLWPGSTPTLVESTNSFHPP